MKIIIDTNILISAILKNRDPEAVINFIALRNDFSWIVSPEIMTEYKNVIARKKFKLPFDIQHKWFSLLDSFTQLINVPEMNLDFPRDQKDTIFLKCALACEADFLITGDRDFQEAKKIIKTKIVSVGLFKKLVCDLLS